jgi:lipoyl(octanoyl) transferase
MNKELGHDVDMTDVQQKLVKHVADVFEMDIL